MSTSVERALERMDRTTRDIVKYDVQLYKKTGDFKYLKEAIAIIQNFCDEDEKTVIDMVKRMSF